MGKEKKLYELNEIMNKKVDYEKEELEKEIDKIIKEISDINMEENLDFLS
jgi:hypothetical protein